MYDAITNEVVFACTLGQTDRQITTSSKHLQRLIQYKRKTVELWSVQLSWLLSKSSPACSSQLNTEYWLWMESMLRRGMSWCPCETLPTNDIWLFPHLYSFTKSEASICDAAHNLGPVITWGTSQAQSLTARSTLSNSNSSNSNKFLSSLDISWQETSIIRISVMRNFVIRTF